MNQEFVFLSEAKEKLNLDFVFENFALDLIGIFIKDV